jgi:hypothetical protein
MCKDALSWFVVCAGTVSWLTLTPARSGAG